MKVLTVTAQIEFPRPPNFLRMTDGQTLPIQAVTDEYLQKLGEAWTANLIELARERRKSDAETRKGAK